MDDDEQRRQAETAGAWRQIDAAARQHHGAITRAEAVQAGMSSRSVSRRAATMQWGRPHRGVYTLPGTRATLQRDAAAALLAVGDRALLTGEVALYLYDVLARRPSTIEVLVPATARPARRGGVRIRRTRAYERVRPVTRDGLRLVHATRAIADLAECTEAVDLARHVARAVGLRHCTLGQAHRELDIRATFPGRREYQRAIGYLLCELTHSREESVARAHLEQVGLRPWPRPYPIEAGGIVLAEADIAIVELRYDIEVDGPHHDLPEQVQADKARDRRLGRHGWTVDRFPVEMVVRQPEVFVREVLARVRQLQGSRPQARGA